MNFVLKLLNHDRSAKDVSDLFSLLRAQDFIAFADQNATELRH